MSLKKDPAAKAKILEKIAEKGGLHEGVAREVARELGVPEAEIYGAASFYHLLEDPDTKVRVCMGLTCWLEGSGELLQAAREAGLPAGPCSCLAACDRPPVVLRDRTVLAEVSREDLDACGGDWKQLQSSAVPEEDWRGHVGPEGLTEETGAMLLGHPPDESGEALAAAMGMGPEKVIAEVEASGLQGRGGAGFPAHIKWKGVRSQPQTLRYVVLNADEGEPGTFKDREVLLRRPDKVVEGLAIAARAVGAGEIYCYLRGEFGGPWRSLERAIQVFEEKGHLDGLRFHLHEGHGAYICGEETALLEALEGGRGMPRLKPPFPTENGLWGRPTLIHNVETIACVPAIVTRGGKWFHDLGRTGPGSKLYCISGHVERPGVYELPLGVTLDELVEEAGGYRGELKAFSPGGASSGFLPAAERERPLDFKSLQEAGSMLGSAGVVVLNESADLGAALREVLRFFEVESCGQCAPCRIGTRYLREAVDLRLGPDGSDGARPTLRQVAEVSWEMNEGSICGLGQAASLPLTSMLRHFPEVLPDE